MRPRFARLSDRRQRGASLIEALVAMLTVAIGLLGIAGLQASSLRFARLASTRTAVAFHLADMAERVRSNPASTVAAYSTEATPSEAGGYAQQRRALEALSSSKTCDSDAGQRCSPNELAAHQLARWRIALDHDLPGGAGFITGSRDTGYRITVMWRERAANDVSPRCEQQPADARLRNCCPEAAKAPEGVRCASLEVVS